MTIVAVLGGGQLGRMLHQAGSSLGVRCRFLDPASDACAGLIAPIIHAPFDDANAIERLIDGVSAVTYENENVPIEVVQRLSERLPVAPGADSLRIGQHRARERELLDALGIACAPHRPVCSLEDLRGAVRDLGTPGILKAVVGGFDGRGQAGIRVPCDCDRAWSAIARQPALYERVVEFTRELSIVGVRSRAGEIRFYPVVESLHKRGILVRTLAPAPGITPELEGKARDIASRIVRRVAHVGVFALELFETDRGPLVNEFASRVHNTGHWTIEGARASQFENHLRAVLDMPLGETGPTGAAVMLNLIGSVPDDLDPSGEGVHLYGKAPRPERKIGHVTCMGARLDEAIDRARSCSPTLARAADLA